MLFMRVIPVLDNMAKQPYFSFFSSHLLFSDHYTFVLLNIWIIL